MRRINPRSKQSRRTELDKRHCGLCALLARRLTGAAGRVRRDAEVPPAQGHPSGGVYLAVPRLDPVANAGRAGLDRDTPGHQRAGSRGTSAPGAAHKLTPPPGPKAPPGQRRGNVNSQVQLTPPAPEAHGPRAPPQAAAQGKGLPGAARPARPRGPRTSLCPAPARDLLSCSNARRNRRAGSQQRPPAPKRHALRGLGPRT